MRAIPIVCTDDPSITSTAQLSASSYAGLIDCGFRYLHSRRRSCSAPLGDVFWRGISGKDPMHRVGPRVSMRATSWLWIMGMEFPETWSQVTKTDAQTLADKTPNPEWRELAQFVAHSVLDAGRQARVARLTKEIASEGAPWVASRFRRGEIPTPWSLDIRMVDALTALASDEHAELWSEVTLSDAERVAASPHADWRELAVLVLPYINPERTERPLQRAQRVR